MQILNCNYSNSALNRLVESFEAIAQNLVDQENFDSLEIVGDDITIKAERVSLFCLLFFIPLIACSFNEFVIVASQFHFIAIH